MNKDWEYQKAVKKVSIEDHIPIKQLEKELEDYI